MRTIILFLPNTRIKILRTINDNPYFRITIAMLHKPEKDHPFDVEVSVAVIGGGACGLTAAIAAARDGAEVYVFERDKNPAGATAMSYGSICAAQTIVQAEGDIPDTTKALAEDIMLATRGQTDADLVKIMANESGAVIDWFTQELGFDLTIERNWKGFGHRCPRLHGTPNRSGVELMAMLLDAASNAGVTVITQAQVTQLLENESSDGVCGFIYDSPDGPLTVGCGALILACGGFAANHDLVAKHIPYMSNALFYGCEGHKGEAIIWGEAMGAKLADLGGHQSLGSLADPDCFIVPHTLLVDGGLQVNIHGERFENELEDISGQARRIIKQTDAKCWMIYDKKGHEKAWRIFGEYRDSDITKPYKSANDLETLSKIIGIDSQGFQKTMTEVQGLIQSGEAGKFGRKFSTEQALEAPFYAVRVTGALFHTQGGLCVDDTARVQKNAGGRFENVFAGGGAAQSISGPAEWGYVPGAGLMSAVTLGRIAGQNAAKQTLQRVNKV